ANRLTAQGAATYSYDNDGNRLTKVEGGVTSSYGYDAESRLVSVSGPTTASYAYDGDGYRVRKTVGGAATTYAWDRLGAGGLGTVVGDGTAEYAFWPAAPCHAGRRADRPQGRLSRGGWDRWRIASAARA